MGNDEAAALQDDELTALAAIYPSEHLHIDRDHIERQGESLHVVSFSFPIDLVRSTNVYIVAQDHAVQPGTTPSSLPLPPASDQGTELQLRHLPPLAVTASLCSQYPLRRCPRIERLAAPFVTTSQQREWITLRLEQMWEETQGEILWSWAEWLREGWTEEVLDKTSKTPFTGAAKGTLAFYEASSASTRPTLEGVPSRGHDLSATLRAYDRLARQSAFDSDRFMCGICLEAKKGSASVKLGGCGHVFCRECVNDYLKLHLTEGSLNLALSCPDPSCMSSSAGRNAHATLSDGARSEGAISLTQLEEILATSPDLVQRLHFLQNKAAAESDPSAIPCPRPDCQELAPAREEDKGNDRWQAFRECPRCSMCFCAWCRFTWHAPNPCAISSSDALLTRYDSGTDSERRAMELRYGRKNLLKLKAQFEEDRANREWLKERTQACPHCSSPVEKSMGCNHMTCSHCASHFCYLCGHRLNPKEPYRHFNTPGSSCYNRLFDGIIQDGGAEGPPGGEGGQGNDPIRQAEAREQEQHLQALAAIEAVWGA
ncbi:unnamed protein product [Parajaminaea phylloscopi]